MGKTYSRGQALLERPKDEVFDAVIEACKENKWKVFHADKTKYEIKAEVPFSWLRNEWASTVAIYLTENEQYGNNMLLDVYNDYSPYPKPAIITKFFDALARKIPLTMNYSQDLVKEIRPGEGIKGVMNPSLMCTVCNRNIFSFSFQKGIEKLCKACFEQSCGNTVLATPNAQYYGGHKAFLAGGLFSDFQTGSLVMTEKYLLFQTNDKKLENRWEIIIPIKDVIIGGWGVQEVARRKQMSGFGGSVDINQDGQGDIAMGGGFIHESGKAHRLVIPYIDQNGIPQEPRFGISSLGGKAIREWSAKFYERVVEVKRENGLDVQSQTQQLKSQESAQEEDTNQTMTRVSNEDPIQILKIRLAKGEITKEQYDELRKVFES
jgi:hypothetical protein